MIEARCPQCHKRRLFSVALGLCYVCLYERSHPSAHLAPSLAAQLLVTA